MIDHLTWHQTANLAWIAGAVGFGWGFGRSLSESVMAALLTRIDRFMRRD